MGAHLGLPQHLSNCFQRLLPLAVPSGARARREVAQRTASLRSRPPQFLAREHPCNTACRVEAAADFAFLFRARRAPRH